MSAEDARNSNVVLASITGTGLLKIVNGASEGAKRIIGGIEKEAEIYTYLDAKKVEHSQWAFLFTSYTGYITDIRTKEIELDSGNINILQIFMNDNDEQWIISTPKNSRYAYDFLEKAVNVDFGKPIKFGPWSMDKDGKNRKGVTLSQSGKKIDSYFWKDKERINDFPGIPEGEMDSDLWKAYFNVTVKKFLYDHLEKNILPKLEKESPDILNHIEVNEDHEIQGPKSKMPEDTDKPNDDLPF